MSIVKFIKKPMALTTLIFLVVTPFLMLSTGILVWKRTLETLAHDTEHRLTLYVRGLESSIQLNEQITIVIASSVNTVQLLGDPYDPSLQQATNRYLENLNAKIHAKTLYIMDQQGTTIAASNWREAQSFVGQNYAFRPYFQDAIQGQSSHAIGLGVTSGELGLYIAEPIRVDGHIRGVAVTKTGLDRHRLLSIELEQWFVVTDRNGVVFLSSRDEWLYTTVRPIPPDRQKIINEAQQYPDKPLAPFPAVTLSALNGITRLVHLPGVPLEGWIPGFGPATHLSQSAFFLQQGWEIRTFASLVPAHLAVWGNLASTLLLSFFVYLGALLLLQRRLYIRGLREAAIHDPLTGLHTRRYLFDAVNTQFSQLNRRKTDCLVSAMLDIDYFKRVNDIYGHQGGDHILKAVAHAIKQSIRKGDIAVRYGGEEFTVMLGIEEGESALTCIERIRANVQALKFGPPLETVQITLSAGIAHHQAGENLDDLLARADVLLYRAKNQGRNRACYDRNDPPAHEVRPARGETP